MKPNALIAWLCITALSAPGQDPSPRPVPRPPASRVAEADPEPPEPPVAPVPPVAVVAPVPEVLPDQPDIERQVERAKRQVVVARRQAGIAQRDAFAAAQDQYGDANRMVQDMGEWHFRGPGMEGRSLVIRASETDPKSLGAAQEDLNVMARILHKVVSNEKTSVMGVTIHPGSDNVRNLLVEGYGAIFLLHVDYPLRGAHVKADVEKPKEPGNSTWDEAKEELYGVRRRPRHSDLPPAAEYDPKKVEKLKDSLLEALKNASNIRALKEHESVTIVVTSGGDGARAYTMLGGGGGGGEYSRSGGRTKTASGLPGEVDVTVVTTTSGEAAAEPPGPSRGATLTIRANKGDIDAFFKGRLTLEEFRRKAQMVIY